VAFPARAAGAAAPAVPAPQLPLLPRTRPARAVAPPVAKELGGPSAPATRSASPGPSGDPSSHRCVYST